jgi:hypothetical protein
VLWKLNGARADRGRNETRTSRHGEQPQELGNMSLDRLLAYA